MRLERIEGYLLRLPLKEETRVADAPVAFCETVLARLVGEGVSGWSEVSPGNEPYLTSEWSAATYLTLRDCLAPRVAALRAVGSPQSLDDAFIALKGARCAKAAVEMAWQDLSARHKGEPLWKSLGAEKKPLKVGLTFDRTLEREKFFEALARANEEQFGRVALKMRPGWDVQVLNFARIDSPHHLQLQVDIEGALDLDMHADTLYRMDDFFLNFVEQPLNPRDFVAHAMLEEQLRTPICLDESIESIADAKIAFDVKSCGVVCLKPCRVGGHSSALAIAELAKANDVGRYAGYDLGSSLGYRHLLASAAAMNPTFPTDYLRFEETFAYDLVAPIETTLVEEPGVEEKGVPARSFRYVELWDEPGIGAEPNLEEAKPYILDQFAIDVK